MSEDHSHAGQGPVLLDIGDDVGALVLTMPASLEGAEIEARPIDAPRPHHLPHVGVVARPVDGCRVHSAVFGELVAARYELYVRPDGPVQLTATVTGGRACVVDWPGTP